MTTETRFSPIAASVVLAVAALVASERPLSAAADFPVVIDNCGISTTYAAPPARAVTMNQAATEVMLALGLQDRMIGTAFLDDGISPAFMDAYKRVPTLAQRYPSREVLLAARPDFIYAAYMSAFNQTAAGPRPDLQRMGIRSYVSPWDCPEAYRPAKATLESTYAEIRTIGRIFGVSPRAEKLIASYQAELAEVQRKIGPVAKRPRIFWYDGGNPPNAGACCGMPNEIMRLAGAENIFVDTPGSWKRVNWESIVARNPDVIVLIESRSPASEKERLLLSTKAYASITAVARRRFITIRFGDSTPGVRNISAVTTLAKALYPDKFKTP